MTLKSLRPSVNEKSDRIFSVARVKFVRIKGLEPPRLSASDPKSDVATNYTISAVSQAQR